MAQLNLWQGGVKILTQDDLNEQDKMRRANQGIIKFDTCVNRSDAPVEKIRRTCCSSTTDTGYVCNLRKIFKLAPETCATCNVYQKKS